ncbi:YhdP family protein, partial [Pseudomonas protegens]|uniref:YhdP family phospholipid transporter n=1 Tax=Pseudomonas protegens TaxID=380021 RepID=UPI0038576A3B
MERLIRLFTTLIRWGLGFCALLLVVTALYVSLGRELTPLVAEYQAEVEAKVQQAVGLPVHIGSLEGRWSGLSPILLAHDVVVGDGANALRLDLVSVAPDMLGSLLARDLRVGRLELIGLSLSLKEGADGQWQLEGLPTQQNQPLDPEQLLTRLQQVTELSLLDSQVTLLAQNHQPLALTYVGLNLRTGPSRQRLDLRLTLPDGQRLAMNLRTRIRANAWREAQADLYLSLPQSDWSRWLPARLTQQWKLSELKAGGELWLNWAKGTVQSAALRLNAPQFTGAYAERTPVTLKNLALNAFFQRSEQGMQVQLDSLALNLGDTRWESRLQLQQSNASEKTEELWHVQADRLDLTPITPILDALAPLPEGLATTLERLKVTGGLRNVLLDYRPQNTGDQRLSFAANLDRVGFDAYHGAPAARNVSGSISGDLGQGELRMDSKDFSLHLYP